uniref:non-specific serine/threonine protein kinase n=1 Tax=Knipowitschia caucasica TaxID=637954 RepID=A0AAV2L0Z5_KNICA
MSQEDLDFTNSSSCFLPEKYKQEQTDTLPPPVTWYEAESGYPELKGSFFIRGFIPRQWKPEVDEMMRLKYHINSQSSQIKSGTLFSGYRREDRLPVFIKQMRTRFIPFTIVRQEEDQVGSLVPLEVAVRMKLNQGTTTWTPRVLDWYDIGLKTYIIIERPKDSIRLLTYIRETLCIAFEHERKCKHIFRQLLDTALEMEAKGIFHRDITSANVVVLDTKEIKVQLRNFGKAKVFEPGQMFKGPLGSVESSSPESFRRQPYSPSAATVWQLGVVLYSMMFNRRPLITKETISSSRKVPIRRNASPECRNILRRCLEKDLKDRISLGDLKTHPWLLE